jgi:hypothetical protein
VCNVHKWLEGECDHDEDDHDETLPVVWPSWQRLHWTSESHSQPRIACKLPVLYTIQVNNCYTIKILGMFTNTVAS